MKKIFKALLNAVVLSAVLLSLTACNDSSADAAASGKNGAAPYELTEDERALLSALGITDMNSLILTFRAPAGFRLTAGKLLICNYKDAPAKPSICALRPYEARVYLYNA